MLLECQALHSTQVSVQLLAKANQLMPANFLNFQPLATRFERLVIHEINILEELQNAIF